LTLELTETAALTGSGEGLDMITRLRDLGVNIAIDDYGTGLSTLDYLKKIRRSASPTRSAARSLRKGWSTATSSTCSLKWAATSPRASRSGARWA
jgi:hypothetical protein